MRYFGNKNAVPTIPVPPDSVTTFLLAANTAQAIDYPAKADIARVSFASTAGAALAGVFNGNSTGALWGSSATSTPGSTSANGIVPTGSPGTFFQINKGSTGCSVIAPAAGVCSIEWWTRGGSTSST